MWQKTISDDLTGKGVEFATVFGGVAMEARLYLIQFEVQVTDGTATWQAAACRASAQYGMRINEIEDTIGPQKDPNVEDCLALIFTPSGSAGFAPLTFFASEIVQPLQAEGGINLPITAGSNSELASCSSHLDRLSR